MTTSTPLPLSSVRVVAVEQFAAGPFATQMLSDLGAEVIKIEDPTVGGDIGRHTVPFTIDHDSLYFQAFNRNKRSLTLNLRVPSGRAVFHDLVRVSDAVYCNLRGDQPARLGLDYAALKDVNPRIVCCSLSGFGKTGPRAAEPVYDYLVQGYLGYMDITGEPGGPPTKCGVSIIDFAGGYSSFGGLMVGLFQAQRSGVGCDVDVALMDTAFYMLNYLASWYLNADMVPQRTPNSGHQTLVPCENIQTADGWLVILALKDKFYQRLCAALERPDLAADPRFASMAGRREHKAELMAILHAVFKTRTTAEWLERLQGQVPCGPINRFPQAFADEQILARDMIVEFEHPHWGTLREPASPIKIDGGVHAPWRRGPALGEDTDAILRDLLHYPAERIAELRAQGAV